MFLFAFFLFFFPLSQNFQPIVLKIQLFQNRPKSSQSGFIMIYYVVQGPFQAILTSWGVPGALKRPQKRQNFPKTDTFIIVQNPIPIHSQWPKMARNKFLSQC